MKEQNTNQKPSSKQNGWKRPGWKDKRATRPPKPFNRHSYGNR